MKEFKLEFPQKISRYKVVTEDPINRTSLETVRDIADKQVGLYIGSEAEIGRPGCMCEEARAAHVRALKAKWPDLTESQLATSVAAGRSSESIEKRIAFVRKALKPTEAP
jgi:hypothetical protein